MTGIRANNDLDAQIKRLLRERGIVDPAQVQKVIDLYMVQRFGQAGVNLDDLRFIEDQMRSIGITDKEEIKQRQEEYLEGKFNLPANRVKADKLKNVGSSNAPLEILSKDAGLLSVFEPHPKNEIEKEINARDTVDAKIAASSDRKIQEKRNKFILRRMTDGVKEAIKTGELPTLKLTPVQQDVFNVPTTSGFNVLPPRLALPKEYRHHTDETLSYFFI